MRVGSHHDCEVDGKMATMIAIQNAQQNGRRMAGARGSGGLIFRQASPEFDFNQYAFLALALILKKCCSPTMARPSSLRH